MMETRKYHVILTSGVERDIVASSMSVNGGVLAFENQMGELAVVYAPGTWDSAELESRDDKGE